MKKFLKIAFLVLCAVFALTALSACAPAENRVTYYDGTRQISTTSVKRGMAATDYTAPAKPGYTFAGWYLDPGFTTPYSSATRVYNNTTLYAKYIPVSTGTKTGTAAGRNTGTNAGAVTNRNTAGNGSMNGMTGTNNYSGVGYNGTAGNDSAKQYNSGALNGNYNRNMNGANNVNYNGMTGANGINYYNGTNDTGYNYNRSNGINGRVPGMYPNNMSPSGNVTAPLSPATGVTGSNTTTGINPAGTNTNTTNTNINGTRGSIAGTSANGKAESLSDGGMTTANKTYSSTKTSLSTRQTTKTFSSKTASKNERMADKMFCGLGGGFGTGNGLDTNLNGTSLNGTADAATMYDARSKASVKSQGNTYGTAGKTSGTVDNAVRSIRTSPRTSVNQPPVRTRTGFNR